jgi:DNA-directed RNA polymerase specialized sigma24 family protein
MDRLVTPSDYAEFLGLERVFITALLLIGDADRAEAVVLTGIDKLDLETTTRQSLLEQVAGEAATIVPNAGPPPASLNLDPQLRRVMELPTPLRRCFVLRVLVGLGLQKCAETLQLEPGMVDAFAVEASCRLASTYQA